MVNHPLQGTPGVSDFRNPTLLPNFDQPVASAQGTVDLASPGQFVAATARVNATQTATLGGSVTTADITTIQVQNGLFVGGQLSKSVTSAGGDTLSSLAEKFAKAFNDDTQAQNLGLEVDAAAAVLTFNWPGPVGNKAKLVQITEEPATITVGGTAATGDTLVAQFSGAGLPSVVTITSPTTTGNTTAQMATAFSAAITANAVLTAAGVSAASGGTSVVTITATAADEPMSVAVWINVIAPTATIGGSITANDTVSLTFTNAALPGGSQVIGPYTVLVTDTTTTIAQALKALINSNVNMVAANITAAGAAAILTFSYTAANGQIRFSSSVTGSATESVTFTAAPTETLALTTSATETVTMGGTGFLTGGSGPIIPWNNFQFSINSVLCNFRAGQPRVVGDDVLLTMIAQQMPIV